MQVGAKKSSTQDEFIRASRKLLVDNLFGKPETIEFIKEFLSDQDRLHKILDLKQNISVINKIYGPVKHDFLWPRELAREILTYVSELENEQLHYLLIPLLENPKLNEKIMKFMVNPHLPKSYIFYAICWKEDNNSDEFFTYERKDGSKYYEDWFLEDYRKAREYVKEYGVSNENAPPFPSL